MARLTTATLERPSLPLSRHHIRSAEEADDAIRRLNPRRGRASPGPLVIERLLAHAAADSGATAVVSPRERLTYGQLEERSALLAARLAALGAEPEELVGVLADASIPWIVTVAGVWRAGGACLSIDSTVPPRRAAAQLAYVGARFAVAATGWRVPADGVTVVPVDAGEGIGHAPLTREPPLPAQLAMMTFTSGTTGRPKGVAVEHRQLAAYARAMADILGLPPGVTLASPAAPPRTSA